MTEQTKDLIIIKRDGFLMLARWCMEAWAKGKKYLELSGVQTLEAHELRKQITKLNERHDRLIASLRLLHSSNRRALDLVSETSFYAVPADKLHNITTEFSAPLEDGDA